jgi:hypothetical protein
VTDPADKLAYNTQRLAAAERPRRIAGKLLVGEIWVVFELACRLDHVDSPPAFTRGQLGRPGRGVECRGE